MICGLNDCPLVRRSLSNWIKVRQSTKVKGSDEERVQNVYVQESELLMKHLSDPIRRHNVVLNHDNFRLLAILHESLVCTNSYAPVMLCGGHGM